MRYNVTLLFRYERPKSIKQDLIEKLGLEDEKEKSKRTVYAISMGDGKLYILTYNFIYLQLYEWL